MRSLDNDARHASAGTGDEAAPGRAGPRFRARLRACSLPALALAVASPACAQSAAGAPAIVAAAAPDQPSVGATGLQDIVVTAQKRSESAQSIPVTVSAVSGAALKQSGIKDMFQAVQLVPGVVMSRAPDDGLGLTFRGLGAAARPQAFEQSVAMFEDGVFFGKGRLYSTTIFDADRVEFVKGTQSTLLGKNASVGAISIVDKQPGNAFSYDATAGYEAEHEGYQIDAAATLPASDSFSTRVAVHYNDLNGYVHNSVTGNDVPIDKDLGLRITSRWNVTDRLKITGSYAYVDNHRIGSGMQLVGDDVPPAYGDGKLDDHEAKFTDRTSDGDSQHRTRSHVGTVKAEWRLGSHELISQTSYVAYHLRFDDDFDFNKDPYIDFLRFERYRQFTQEVRLQSDASRPFQYMGGFFYMASHWNSTEDQLWGVPAFPPPPAPTSGQLFNGPFSDHFVQDTKTYSGFASGKLEIVRGLSLSGGVRFTREEKDIVSGRTNSAPFTIWNSIANPPFDPTPLSHDASFWDGNASLDYKVAPGISVYAAFGHGSKSGGFVETNSIAVPPFLLVDGKVPAPLVAAGSAIKDEYTKSYEIGFKSEFFQHRLRFNVALFKTDIKNFQDSVFTGGPLGFITDNSPATSKGVEIESAYAATSRLRFNASMTYADATQVSQPVIGGLLVFNPDGTPVRERYRRAQAPKLTLNAGADYKAPLTDTLEGRLGAHVYHRSSMYNERQEEFFARRLTTLDLSAGIAAADGRWSIDVIAKNLTNAISADFGGPSVDPRFTRLESPNQLRTILISASIHY